MTSIVPGTNTPANQYRIMVLSSNATHLSNLTAVANELGHEVVPVKTIRQGMDFLNTKDHVDVAVAEAFLESESVFDFLKELRSKPDRKDVPIMLIQRSQVA